MWITDKFKPKGWRINPQSNRTYCACLNNFSLFYQSPVNHNHPEPDCENCGGKGRPPIDWNTELRGDDDAR